MKTKILTLAFLILAVAGISSAKPRTDIEINFGFFYKSLAPHGSWMEIDAGIYGWRPAHIGFGWRPYSLGRWTWTEYGWYWDSYEPFGWATYHYGRWVNDEYYGWIWIPDYEWGPSWVEWRYDDDYIGWAPLPPYAGFRFGFGIHFSIGWHSHHSHWNFVRYGHFCHHKVHNYFIKETYVNRIFERTKYRTNYYDRENRIINGGVDRDFIERRTGDRIRETNIRTTSNFRDYERDANGRNTFVRAYRPSDEDVARTRDVEIKDIGRAERTIGIEKDKIAIRTSRDNSITVERRSENANRETNRNERVNSAPERERPVIRNDRENSTIPERAVERNRGYSERTFERNNPVIKRNEEPVKVAPPVRETPRQNRGFEMNENRSQQNRVEKQAERSVRSESRSSERRTERSAPPARENNSGSRERRR